MLMILYNTKKKIEVRLCWKFACELRYSYIYITNIYLVIPIYGYT
jgi:hypothetical protein